MAYHRLQRRKQSRRRRRKGDHRDLHQEALVDQEGDGGAGQEVGPHQEEGDPLEKGPQGMIEEGEAGAEEVGPEVEGGGSRDR